jgi:N-dimethylarginine dimethylaminohydrolase
MCPPDYFRIKYSINPWMKDNVSSISSEQARAQWLALHETVAERAEMALIDPAEDFPDMVFTADAGTICNRIVVACQFAHHERQGEARLFAQWFQDHDFDVRQLPQGMLYEGGDVLLDPEEPWLWAGYGYRSSLAAHRLAGEWLDREVLPLKLTDSRFYHVDTCFSVLSGGYVMYYPPAFDADSRALIEGRVPADKRIVIAADDAASFACNAVNVGDAVILNRASDHLKARLTAAGFEPIERPVGEFIKAGGAAKCLTLKLGGG